MNTGRKSLIRLAAKRPVGDPVRRVLLAELQKESAYRKSDNAKKLDSRNGYELWEDGNKWVITDRRGRVYLEPFGLRRDADKAWGMLKAGILGKRAKTGAAPKIIDAGDEAAFRDLSAQILALGRKYTKHMTPLWVEGKGSVVRMQGFFNGIEFYIWFGSTKIKLRAVSGYWVSVGPGESFDGLREKGRELIALGDFLDAVESKFGGVRTIRGSKATWKHFR